MPRIAWFKDLRVTDADQFGGKGANLGELTAAGLPVPPGFVVSAPAFLEAVDSSGAREKLRSLMSGPDPDRDADSASTGELARRLVASTAIPPATADAILAAYHELGDQVPVAVRSSGTSEDSGDTSFAGMKATFTNVRGDEDLLSRIVDCWVSLYGDRVVSYRAAEHIEDEPSIAVVVQTMIPSERSGTMFTADPSTGDPDRVVVEAALGQGEAIVSGLVEPDTYVVARDPLHIVSVRIGQQTVKIVRGPDGADLEIPTSEDEQDERVLTSDQILAVAGLGIAVQDHYGSPQDIEWAMAGGATWLVQSRPITTLHLHEQVAVEPAPPVLLRGLGASSGQASGPVRVLTSPDQGGTLRAGEILVAPMTSPDWAAAIRRAAALVTDRGGMTCHAAIVARELAVPCVVGTRRGTETLHDGQVVTVDGRRGEVYAGTVDATSAVSAGREMLAPHSSETVEGLST